MPEKMTATPIFDKAITIMNFLKGILVRPAASVLSSAKAGTGLARMSPSISILPAAFSA